MKRSTRQRLCSVLACAGAFGWVSSSAVVQAQMPTGAEAAGQIASPEERARQHFERALELYRAGRYSLALEQLNRAAALDPRGKDLLFNLALVHEKLGQLPDAIAALQHFRELEPDAAEQERAEATLTRLRGALVAGEVLTKSPPPPCPAVAREPAAARAPTPVVVGASAVALVSLVVGTVFGVKALLDDVGGERTSAELSIARLRARGRRAEREALLADLAFSLGFAAGGTALGLLWLAPPSEAKQTGGLITLRSDF